MTFSLIPLLVKLGVPEELRKPVQYAILVLVAVGIFFAAKAIYDRSVVDDYVDKRAADTIEARDDAAEERAKDTIRDTINDKDRTNAIESAPPGGELSPAARALACERLRQLGRIPPACRPSGGDGSEAGPD